MQHQASLSQNSLFDRDYSVISARVPKNPVSTPLRPTGWGISESPFGVLFFAWSKKGLMEAGFIDTDTRASRWSRFPNIQDNLRAQDISKVIFSGSKLDLPLEWMGTPFQCKVWNALQSIPMGECVSYSAFAERLGRPNAVRAIASAIAHNPLAVVIPCHRVVPKRGGQGEYRWGAIRKSALLEWERTCILKT